MSDRRLQVFQTVARLLSFTKAAEALHMTQPAVTFQVRQLEAHFDTRLFDRTHNRISLTEVGQRVYEYAERISRLYEEMDGAVRELTGDAGGTLLIGASYTIAEYMLPALLGGFKTSHPEVGIRLRVSNTEAVVAMVEDNEVDLGVVEAPVPNRGLVVELCRVDELVAVTAPGHPLADKERVAVAELLEYPYIGREKGPGRCEVVQEYLEAAAAASRKVDTVMEFGGPEAVKGAVEAGMGVAVLSRTTIQKELRLGTLVAIPLDPPLERPFSFVRQKQKFRLRAMVELLDFASAYCGMHQGAD